MKKDLNYQKFGEAFWKFYTENGFGTKSKSDTEPSVIYSILQFVCTSFKHKK